MGCSYLDSRVSKASLAEALLGLVTSPDRAEAIAGDLVEQMGRGRVDRCRFVLHLSGVAFALLLAGIGAARVRTVWLFASGLVLWFLLYGLIRATGALLGVHPFDSAGLDCLARPLSASLYLAAALLVSNFLTGVALGSRAPAGGLNGSVPLAAFWSLFTLAAPAAAAVTASATWHCTLYYLLGLPLLYVAPLLYGAAVARRRAPA